MKSKIQKLVVSPLEYLLPIILMILLFLTKKQVMPSVIFVACALLTAIYFLAVRSFFASKIKTECWVEIAANFMISVAIGLKIVSLFTTNSALTSTISVLGVIFVITFFYLVIKEKQEKTTIMCLLFNILGIM